MKKLIKKFFPKKDSSKKNETQKSILEQKVEKGISFTINRYGEALKDLAQYDRGEKLVN